MCVTCVSSVDLAAWNAVGAGAAVGAVWRHATGHAPRSEVARFVTDLQAGALDRGPEQTALEGIWPFLAVLVSYVAAGLLLKSAVLNWVVGPLYLVTVLHGIPTGYRAVTAAVRG